MTDATEEFGPYLVYERLGQGGMATVHRAEKRGVGIRRPVALKRLFPHVAADPELVKLFVDEARLASHLHHANVAQTYELGRVGNTFFIAMEYAAGPTLAHIVRQCEGAAIAIPLPITANILAQVCEALDYAHNLCDESGQSLRIIHRDVSPANIIVTISGLVKLIDFGIAKATTSRVKTQTGFIKGKFAYIAPEYISGKIDARVDLFALGVVAHEMLTGHKLFEGKDDFETMANIRDMVVKPPSRRNPRVTPELDEIVMTALERDPAKRWQTAGAMQSALASASRGLGAVVGGPQLVEWVEWAFDQPQDPRAITRTEANTSETAVGRNAHANRRRDNGASTELVRAQAEIAAAAERSAAPQRAPSPSPSDSDATAPHERISLALSDFETLTPAVNNPAPAPIAPPHPPAVSAWAAQAPAATSPSRPVPARPSQAPRDAAPSRAASQPPRDVGSPPREVASPPRDVVPPPARAPARPQAAMAAQPRRPRPALPFENATRRAARPQPQRMSRTFESAPPPPPLPPPPVVPRSSGALDATAPPLAPAPQPAAPPRPSGPVNAMVTQPTPSRELEVAPPVSTFDEPSRDLPAPIPKPGPHGKPRSRARPAHNTGQDPPPPHETGSGPKARPTTATAEPRPVPRDRRRRTRAEPDAAARKRRHVVWLILLMVALGAAAMAAAYYWPAG